MTLHLQSIVQELNWSQETMCEGVDTLYFVVVPEIGRFSVLDRLTGYGDGNVRDIETGFRDLSDKMWIASGNKDIRNYPMFTLDQAIGWIKSHANTLQGE